MSKLDLTNSVAQHNALITGISKMDKTPLKIFELLVSTIDSTKPQPDKTVVISKQAIFEMFDAKDKDKDVRFKQHITTMQKQTILIQTEDGWQSIVPVPFAEWKKRRDEVIFEFNEKIIPYIYELKENFTQYLIADIARLNSKYSIIIYKLLNMKYRQYSKYGNVDCKNPYFTIEELREITDTKKDYTRLDNFETNVIAQPLSEINKNTNFNITYEKIKRGRSVHGIQFYIEHDAPAPMPKLHNEKQFPEKELNITEQLGMAMQDVYIQKLLQLELLQIDDLQSIVKVYEEVVPIYVSMDSLSHETQNHTIKNHLPHIRKSMLAEKEPHKRNNAKYLKISAEQEIARLRKNPDYAPYIQEDDYQQKTIFGDEVSLYKILEEEGN